MKKAIEYYMYRYFIVDNNQQTCLDSVGINEIRNRFMKFLENSGKSKYLYRNIEYIFVPVDSINDTLFICKYSKSKKITRHVESEDNINTDKEIDYPFVYIIIWTDKQVILIQKNTSIFEHTNVTKNRLEHMFKSHMGDFSHSISIESITDREQFWATLKSAKKVYNLDLKLSAPNLFGARIKANEFMRLQKQQYNISDLELKLNNPEGELQISKENMDDFIEYAAEGGGRYKLKYSDGNEVRTLDSKEKCKRIILPDEITKQDYTIILEELRKFDRMSD